MSSDEERNADAFNTMLKAMHFKTVFNMLESNYKPPVDFISPLAEDATALDKANHDAACMFYEGVKIGLKLAGEQPGNTQ